MKRNAAWREATPSRGSLLPTVIMSHLVLLLAARGALAQPFVTVGRSTCAILSNKSVKCWGEGAYGMLGLGSSYTAIKDAPDPTLTVDFGTGRTAKSLTGRLCACALLDDDSVKCWGRNHMGQVGNGLTADQFTPVSVDLGSTAKSVSALELHACAVLSTGSVKCWGHNNRGQLGDGSTVDKSLPTPTSTLGAGRTASMVSVGFDFTCVVLDNGDVKCWGSNNYGQLGDGSLTAAYSPPSTKVNLGEGRTAKSVSAGEAHACAVLDNNDLVCWGQNANGQLGDGSTTQRLSPVKVNLGTGRTAKSVAAGVYSACAVLDDDSLKCWGYNGLRQLGQGTSSIRLGAASNEIGDNLPTVNLGAGLKIRKLCSTCCECQLESMGYDF
jgi:alpha-tubulin suppressor-like RCC1 family protein